MHVRWFGHACFLIEGAGRRVLVDPYQPPRRPRPGLRFAYPPLPRDLRPDVALISHDHFDHAGLRRIPATTPTVRYPGRQDAAGLTFTGIEADHDAVDGRALGHVVMLCWRQGRWRFCHLSDLGQPALRPEQRAAIGEPDVLFVPVGGAPTMDGPSAARLVRQLRPGHVFPMHYRTAAINFLDTADAFLAAMQGEADIVRSEAGELELPAEPERRGRTAVHVLAPPPPRMPG